MSGPGDGLGIGVPARRKKKLILVVHGVGQLEPGETLGLLASGLEEAPGTETTAATHQVLEGTRFSHRKGPDLFACHTLRRKTEKSDDLFAEVYWADVAVMGIGFVQILLDLFQVILGLGHLVRESADHVYARKPMLHMTASIAVWLMHGPLAAINSVVLITAFVAMFMELSGYSHILTHDSTRFFWPTVLGFGLMFIAGFFYLRTGRYLIKHFFRSMVAISIALIAFTQILHRDLGSEDPLTFGVLEREVAATAPTKSDAPQTPDTAFFVPALTEQIPVTLALIGDWSRGLICDWVVVQSKSKSEGAKTRSEDGAKVEITDQRTHCVKRLVGIYALSMFLVLAQWLIWLVLLSVTTVLLFGHFFWHLQVRARGYHAPPSLAPVALSAMMMFWLLILSCIWAVMIFLYPDFGGHRALFISAFHPVYVNWLILILVLLVATWCSFGPELLHARKIPPERYFNEKTGAPRSPPRMIVADPIAMVIMACPPLLLIVMMILTLRTVDGSIMNATMIDEVDQLSREYFDELFLSAVLLGVTLYLLRDRIATGISIASDIINYMRVWKWEKDPKKRVYPQRDRIEGRFIVVAETLIRRHQPDEVIIVAHSQGTVIALDALRKSKGHFVDEQRAGRRWTLITMGSPYTHLYHNYFPGPYYDVPDRSDIYADRWINIFRIDDFIGTHIGHNTDWPVEVPVHCGGHSFYWVDPPVKDVLHREISPD
ncbi:MAG: hypothetical protein AAF415_12605 [Pseudomonadota bacterium]